MSDKEFEKYFQNRKITKESEIIREEVNKLIVKAKSVYARIGLTDLKLFRKLLTEDEMPADNQCDIRNILLSELWDEYIMYKQSISSLSNRTSKELREAHNIEKMYKAGAFNGQ
jgi:hypothetical protein